MKIIPILLILIFLLAGCQKVTPSPADFKLIQASDLHVLSPELFDDSSLLREIEASGDGKRIFDSYAIFTHLLDTVKQEAPDALILTGDLSFNGDLLSHQLITKDLAKLKASGVPVYVIPGNHDWSTRPYGYFGTEGLAAEPTTVEQFSDLYADFGWNQAFSRDTASFSYAVEINPTTWLILIDVNQPGIMSLLLDETTSWVEHLMRTAKASGIQVITASHQNLFQHHALFSRGFMMINADKLKAVFQQYPRIIHLSGHMHVQHQVSQDSVTEVALSSLAIWPHQAATITQKGYQAKSIYDTKDPFYLASLEFFRQVSLDKAQSRFEDHAPDNALELSSFVADTNQAYFSGDLRGTPKLNQDPRAKAWLELSGSARFADYIKAILAEPAVDHRIKDFYEINHP